MARIELRDCTVRIRDGLTGSGVINEAAPATTDTDVDVSTIVLNTLDTDKIPVGARFTVNTVNNVTTYIVTARLPASGRPTTNITFSPAWGAEVPANADALTFLPCSIDIKVGEGNLTYTEAKAYNYMLDRGNLDTVREGDQQPVDVSIEFVYEHVTSGTNETITPIDALKQKNNAADWVSSATDQCEPYAVDVIIFHDVPCGTTQDETTTLPDFRYEKLEFNLKDATISVSGKCNAVEALVVRG